MDNQQQTNTPAPQPRNKRFIIVLLALVIGGSTFGTIKYIHAMHHEDTEDAQVDANISPVIPRISGYVTEVRVKDNQQVKEGDTLVVLDNRNEQILVEQAQAALVAAQNGLGVAHASTSASRANIASYQANVATADAQIEAAKVTLKRAKQDYDRYANLIKDHSITQQQFEQAEAAMQSAERQLRVLEDQKRAAMKMTFAASSQTNATAKQVGVANATIQQRIADLDRAELNLSYTVITAPASGTLSKVSVQLGQLVQPGQALFSVVLDTKPWVIANFKETQITKMREGQPVSVKIDAYPDHKFKGKVASFSPATGSRFALLPPDNASGNFVKVVQRLPVKIELTADDEYVRALRPGMNADVDVNID